MIKWTKIPILLICQVAFLYMCKILSLKFCKFAQLFLCVCFSSERKFERIERKFKLHIPGLRQYNEKATRAFMKDLSDGFFPSELQVSAIRLPPYLSALDFCNYPVWNIEFEELDIFPSLNWIFLPAVACKIQVWNRLKIKFVKLDISNWIIAKIK